MPATTLETPRLRLVLPSEAHLEAFFDMYSDEVTIGHIPHTRVTTKSAAWFKIATQLGHWQLRGFGFWTIVQREDDAVVGNAGLLFPADNPELEIGWLVARRHWRKGVAREAVAAIVEHAFGAMGAKRLMARIAPANVASIALANSLGMQRDEAASTSDTETLFLESRAFRRR